MKYAFLLNHHDDFQLAMFGEFLHIISKKEVGVIFAIMLVLGLITCLGKILLTYVYYKDKYMSPLLILSLQHNLPFYRLNQANTRKLSR